MAKNKHQHYNQPQADEFVEYLGCWKTANPKAALASRSDADYRRLLHKLIEVNANRHDSMGRCEILAAKMALDRLDCK